DVYKRQFMYHLASTFLYYFADTWFWLSGEFRPAVTSSAFSVNPMLAFERWVTYNLNRVLASCLALFSCLNDTGSSSHAAW
ncbi:hypothetical protein, partial [Serratia sp. 14-2641]|uniref:hypothetical protein n=1 Tax=Serratia sp. 14-2641 TaxID=1841657 RepID=UPI001A7E071F